jgi:hypothetical protein
MECKICHQTKEDNDFYFRKEYNMYRKECKECFKIQRTKYRNENSDKIKESKNKYYYTHQELCCKNSRDWYYNNKDLKNIKHKNYMRNRRQNDICFKIYSNIQSRI